MRTVCLFIAACGLLASPLQAEKLGQWLQVLPDNTLGCLAIRSAPELLQDWQASGYGRLLADPEIQKWLAPLHENGVPIWDLELQKSTGEGLEASLQRLRGSLLLVCAADSLQAFQDTHQRSPFVILLEAGDQRAQLEARLAQDNAQELAAHPGWRALTQDVGGIPLHAVATSEAADARWHQAYACVEDVLILGDQPALLQHFITALKTGSAPTPAPIAGHLERHARLIGGSPDLSLYLNTTVLMKWLQQSAGSLMQGAAAFALDPKTLFRALGAHEFESLALGLDLTPAQTRLDFTLLHPAAPAGLISLLRGSATGVSQPPFIPADAASCQVMRQDLGQAYSSLLAMVGRLGPIALMATAQLGAVEEQLGFRLQQDLFGSLGDEIVTLTEGTAAAPAQIIALQVRDHPRLTQVLTSLRQFLTQGFGLEFTTSPHRQHRLHTYQASTPAGPSAGFSYCLTPSHLLLSTGGSAPLLKILDRLDQPGGPSIWDTPGTQQLLAALPGSPAALGIADASRQLLLILDAFSAAQGQVAGKKKGLRTKGRPPGIPTQDAPLTQPGAEAPALMLDPQARPSLETLRKYLGTEVSGTYHHPDAIHLRTLSRPAP